MTLASIDIGTNTVLLLIAEYDKQKKIITPLLNEYRIPRIGKGVDYGENISKEKEVELLNILKDYKALSEQYKCAHFIISATNAFRIAANAGEIINRVNAELNLKIKIISGDEEARLSYLGAAYNFNNENILVIDIGGGSTELITGREEKIFYRKSFQVGVVAGTEKFFGSDPPSQDELLEFNKYLQKEFLLKDVPPVDKAVAIAGTPTTLSCIKNNLNEFDEAKIEGSTLNFADIKSLIEEIKALSKQQIKQKYSKVVDGREDVLLAGTIILHFLMERLNLKEVKVSGKGLRYGAVIDFFE